MDGGSLADVIKRQRCIPEAVLSLMVQRLLKVRFYYIFIINWFPAGLFK